MDPQAILDGRRPLTKEEIAQIKTGVSRPKDVDQTLFESVLDNLMEKYIPEIVGVETNNDIKTALAAREVMEEERNARLQIKLTQASRKANNYPSDRDSHLPKYYRVEEIPAELRKWSDRLQEELLETFGFKGNRVELNEIVAFISEWAAQQPYPMSSSVLGAAAKRINEIGIREDQFPQLANDLSVGVRELLPKQVNGFKMADLVTESLTGEIYLTAEQIEAMLEGRIINEQNEDAVTGINYSSTFHGDQANLALDPEINASAVRETKKDLRRQLRRLKIPKRHIKRLTVLISDRFNKALVLPGSWVGNNMSSAFGEAATQQTLNTFHTAGNREGRQQITGFPKFEAILDAVENPKSNTLTIFLNQRYNGEQLRLRIPKIQMTNLSDLIDSHRIIPSTDPQPRWEVVHDVINGINYDVTYDARLARYNLHRKTDIFMAASGRLLEIKLNTKEMFFRRISLSQIANAIEEMSADYRVTTSSLDIGLIYVYFKFTSLPQLGGNVPEFAKADQFTFALENLVYPELLSVQIGGIYGIEYVAVKSFHVHKAIDFGNSELEVNTDDRRVIFPFFMDRTIFWALTEAIIKEFIFVKLRRFIPRGYDPLIQYNPNKAILSFRTAGLRVFDYEENKYKPLTLQNLKDELQIDTKIRIYELLRHNHFRSMEVPTTAPDATPLDGGTILGDQAPNALAPNFGLTTNLSNFPTVLIQERTERTVPVQHPVRLNPNDPDQIIVEFDNTIITELGYDMKDVASTLESVFSFNDYQAKATLIANDATIILSGIRIDPGEIKKKEGGNHEFDDLSGYVEFQLRKMQLVTDKIVQSSLRWYYSAEGKNFIKVLSHPDVDPVYTRTDNVVEAYRALGVESCRSILLEEIAACNDPKLNPAHIELLADAMTYRTPGDKPLAQNHYGMTKRGAEFVSLMWETTTKVAMRAGLGQEDNLQSFTSKILTGNLSRSGQLTDEDRDAALRDRDIFKWDSPVSLNVPETPEIKILPPVSGRRVAKVEKPAEPEESIRVDRIRHHAKKTPSKTFGQPLRPPTKGPVSKVASRIPLPSPSRRLGGGGGPGSQFGNQQSQLK